MKQINGMPVVTLSDGIAAAIVKNVLVDPLSGTLIYILAELANSQESTCLIPVEKVLGIGGFAVIIQSQGDMIMNSDIRQSNASNDRKNGILGTRILTRKGDCFGFTGGVFVEEAHKQYAVTGVSYIPDDLESSSGIIPKELILTYGKEFLIVHEQFEEKLKFGHGKKEAVQSLPQADMHENGACDGFSQETCTLEQPSLLVKADSESNASLQHTHQGEPAIEAEHPFPLPEINQEDNALLFEAHLNATNKFFDFCQKHNLFGKKVTKTIYDNKAQAIIHIGEMITDAVYDQIQESGKLIELFMNYEA